MAEFIIALFAGVGFSALFFGASFLWHERAMITREFKARYVDDPPPPSWVGLDTTGTTGTLERESAQVDPDEGYEFKWLTRESDLTGFDSAELAEPPPVEVTTFDGGDHEFNLGEALYGTPYVEALEDADPEFEPFESEAFYDVRPHLDAPTYGPSEQPPFPKSAPYIDADTEGPYMDTPPDPTHAIEVLDAYPAEDTAYAKALQDAMDGPRIDPAYGPLQDAIRARLAERPRL